MEQRSVLVVTGDPAVQRQLIRFFQTRGLDPVLADGMLYIRDQELLCHLEEAARSLRVIIERTSPRALLTSAYEGGHPDHDCCNFLVNHVAKQTGVPAWEMPLYHRDLGGQKNQEFWDAHDGEQLLEPNYAEIKRKQQMIGAYGSQSDTLKQFTSPLERFRPLTAERYDYFHPPHPGQLNYEAWGWPISGLFKLAVRPALEA